MSKLLFDEPTHTYWWVDGDNRTKLTSVSTLVSEYTKPFDSDKMAFFVAKKRGVTKEEVLQEWAADNKNSCDIGSEIHMVFEDWFKRNKPPEEKHKQMFDDFMQLFPYTNKDVILSEIQLADVKYNIAGTSDIVVELADGKHFDICDFKTNKKFDYYSKYNEYLLPPINFLQNCKMNIYGLQLSLYAYLYEKTTGKKLRKLTIYYRDRVKNTWQVIHIPYMRCEVAVLLKHHINKWKN